MKSEEMITYLYDLHEKYQHVLEFAGVTRYKWTLWIEQLKTYEQIRTSYRYMTRQRPHMLLQIMDKLWKQMPNASDAWMFIKKTNRNIPEYKKIMIFMNSFISYWNKRPYKRIKRGD